MKNLVNIFTILLSLIILTSCGGSKDLSETDAGDIPDWYLNTPEGDNYIYASASSVSRDMELAISKATTEARAKLARTLELKVNSMQNKFDEEVGSGENSELLSQYTQATKTIVSKELTGSKIVKKKIEKAILRKSLKFFNPF